MIHAMYSKMIPSLLLLAIFSPMMQAASPIADKALEVEIRRIIQEPMGDLTEEKLLKLFILEAPGKSIKDLTGLEKCKNLALIRLSNNQIVDLKPIKDLANVQSLDLANNKISDIKPIAGLIKLQYIELSGNQIAPHSKNLPHSMPSTWATTKSQTSRV
jgi:Leucine-rich repeat (LRR) protein